jgi:hypothetical protein
MPDPTPQIDFSQIEFPSDRLTIRDLRRAFPHAFDLPGQEAHRSQERGYGRQSVGDALDGIIDAERLLAGRAFKEALGEPYSNDEAAQARWDIIEGLVSDYRRAGLASGEHQSNELIRGIESQAADQAQRHRGRAV